MSDGKIQVVTDKLHDLSDSVKQSTSQISIPKISNDTSTTISGNQDAQKAIKKINKIVSSIKETCDSFGDSLKVYADSMKAADKYDL